MQPQALKQYIFGVDPGRKGAVAWIDADTGEFAGVADAGSADPTAPALLLELFQQARLVVIEHPEAFAGPFSGKTQMILAEGFGMVAGIANLAGAPIARPTASKWKRALAVTSDKETSIEAVRAELAPEQFEQFTIPRPRSVAVSDDRCEAYLLARYGFLHPVEAMTLPEPAKRKPKKAKKVVANG